MASVKTKKIDAMIGKMVQAIMCQTKSILAGGLALVVPRCRINQNSQIGQLKKSRCQCKRAQPNVTYTRVGSPHPAHTSTADTHTHTYDVANNFSEHTSNENQKISQQIYCVTFFAAMPENIFNQITRLPAE